MVVWAGNIGRMGNLGSVVARVTVVSGWGWARASGRAPICIYTATTDHIAAHRLHIARPSHPIHAPCPSSQRLADIERSSIGSGDCMAGPHLVGQPSSLSQSCDPWARCLCLCSYAALHHPTQSTRQATPVRAKVTARPRPRPIMPPCHTRVPEHRDVHPGVLPPVSKPHQRCGTALYCSWPSTTREPLTRPL